MATDLLPSQLIGIPSIDYEHQALIDHLDRLIRNPSNLPVHENISEILSHLMWLMLDHFQNEEKIMKALPMPAEVFARHVDAHQQIIEQMTMLSFDLTTSKPIDKAAVASMVRHWIIDHLLEHDLNIRQYIPA